MSKKIKIDFFWLTKICQIIKKKKIAMIYVFLRFTKMDKCVNRREI